MNFLEKVHAAYLGSRRVEVLAGHLEKLLPQRANVLDVGCGDGALAQYLTKSRPDLQFRGIDVAVRPEARISVELYDGQKIPTADCSIDCALLVDVLHHCEHPEDLLAEARRVSRRYVLIKDHFLAGWLAGPTLRFMDRIGNARHDVALPHQYWTETTWRKTWAELNLESTSVLGDLGLYPPPLTWVFDRGLHFIALLERR